MVERNHRRTREKPPLDSPQGLAEKTLKFSAALRMTALTAQLGNFKFIDNCLRVFGAIDFLNFQLATQYCQLD